jgi:hypothetical protein
MRIGMNVQTDKARRQSKSDVSDFEISNADLGNSRDQTRSQIPDVNIQIRSGRPREEWEAWPGQPFLDGREKP